MGLFVVLPGAAKVSVGGGQVCKCVTLTFLQNQVIFRLLHNFGFLQDMNYTCRLSTRCLLFCPHNQATALRPPWHHDTSLFKRALAKSKNSQLDCDTSDRSAGSHQHASVVITNLKGEARAMAAPPGERHVLNQAILKVAQQKQCWWLDFTPITLYKKCWIEPVMDGGGDRLWALLLCCQSF